MPLISTKGAASAQGFGEFSQSGPVNYIEDVFSTYLYTGNGSTQTITNGIDLSGKGGLVWIKDRDSGAKGHALFDTARGVNLKLQSQSTNGQFSGANQLTAFNTTGFALGSSTDPNGSGTTYVSWTFREQPKFFDVVTYTGNGSSITVSHLLGSTPGCIIVKRTDTSGDWPVYHRSVPLNCGFLNYTSTFTSAQRFSSVTSTDFTINVSTADVNASGGTYVAYIFAHDAGGFGLTGSDNVISCGSFTTDASAYANVNLGYEPQWVLQKQTDSINSWYLTDNMRGSTTLGGQMAQLFSNTDTVESTGTGGAHPTATGFESTGLAISGTFIYIAIRRGPMKVPTTGTSVFTPLSRAGTATTTSVTSISFPPDLLLVKEQNQARQPVWWDKLRGPNRYIDSSITSAEAAAGSSNGVSTLDQSGATYNPDTGLAWVNDNYYSDVYINYFFLRAPSFFDEVCYTGTGSVLNVSHNLGVVPELVIVKRRSGSEAGGVSGYWLAYSSALGNTKCLFLNTTDNSQTSSVWNNTTPTSSVFTVENNYVNYSGDTYVAYLFATCAGVSKVGSYTGTAATLQINCGFTAGSRFVLIKRTDSTGDWYVWDSARGIVAGNDPYLFLNSTAAEVTSTDYVDTYNAGFELTSTAPAGINASGGSYIFLAIA